jgi:hypothetical protein
MLSRKDLQTVWRRGGWAALLACSLASAPAVSAEEGKPPSKVADLIPDPFGDADAEEEAAPLTYAERQKQLREKAEAERAARRSKGKTIRKAGPPAGARQEAVAGGGGTQRSGASGISAGGLSSGIGSSNYAVALALSGSSGPMQSGGGATAIAIAVAGGGSGGGQCHGGNGSGGGNSAVAIASSGGGSNLGGSSSSEDSSSASSDGSSVDLSSIPPLNARILAFAQASLGKQIGNGECWTLGAEALAVAGAKPPEVYDFGDEIPLDEALPGDILQFYSAKFVDGNSYMIMGAPNHTGVLSNISGTRWTMLNQNVNGDRRVQPTTFNVQQLTEGTITVYRAIAR